MKSKDFSSVLRAFSGVLDTAGASTARDQIVEFATAFDADPSSNVSDLVKRIASLSDAGNIGSPNLGDIARLLSALKGFLHRTAKASVLTDFGSVEKLLRDRPSMQIDAFVRMATAPASSGRQTKKRGAPVRDDLVIHHKQRLEASLGDEEKFTAAYDDLRADASIGKPEIVALAKQMTGAGARTEDAALKKIWNRHRSLVVFKAKSRATGGRSAA